MPAPSQLRTNAAATGLSVRYSNLEYIADRGFPPRTDITKDEGTIWVYDKQNLSSVDASGPLAPRAPAPEASWKPTSVEYTLGRFALKELVLQEEIDNADPVFDPHSDAAMQLTDRLLVRREVRAATVAFTVGNWSLNTTLSGTSQWSDDTSDPLGVIETALNATFVQGNLVEMGAEVWSQLRNHPDIVGRYQYTSGGGVSVAQFASLFDLDPSNVLVGRAKSLTSEQGVTETTAYIWGKHFWIGFVAPSPGLRTMTAQATLQRGENRQVTEWANEDPEGTWVKVQDRYKHQVIASDLGYLIVDAVA